MMKYLKQSIVRINDELSLKREAEEAKEDPASF